MTNLRIAVVLIALAAAGCVGRSAFAQLGMPRQFVYRPDLLSPPPVDNVSANDISSNSIIIIGNSSNNAGTDIRPLHWRRNLSGDGYMAPMFLSTGAFADGIPRGVSPSGSIIHGLGFDAMGNARPGFWVSTQSEFQELVIEGLSNAQITDVNDNALAAVIGTDSGVWKARIYDLMEGGHTELGLPEGATMAPFEPVFLNSSDDAFGTLTPAVGPDAVPATWDVSQYSDPSLDRFGFSGPDVVSARITNVSGRGSSVLVTEETSTGGQRLVKYLQVGGSPPSYQRVGIIEPPSGTFLAGVGINEAGQYVGLISDEMGPGSFFDDPIIIPPPPGFALFEASGISDDGLIIGTGFEAGTFARRAVVFQVVPEPASILLWLCAGGLLYLWRFR